MSEARTCLLDSLVEIDPESLPLGTDPSYQFFYFDISSATNGRLQMPATPIKYAEAPSRARRVVKNGDVLMSTVRPNLKAFAYCDLPNDRFVASTGFSVLRASNGNDPRFVLYSILSDDVTRQIESHVVGSNYPAINSSDVRRLKIPAWNPSAQRRIATILTTLDEVIEATEKLVEKHQQIKAGLMHDLFTRGLWTRPELDHGDHHGLPCEATAQEGQLRPTPEEAPRLYQNSPLGLIPKAWKIGTVGGLATYHNGNSFKTNDWVTQGFPIIRIQNLNGEGEFNFYQGRLEESWTVREGDLLFAWAGMRETSFGPRVWRGRTGVLNQHIFKVIPDLTKVTSTSFLSYLLSFHLAEIVKAAHGFKDSFVHVTRRELGGVPVGLPSRKEQTALTAILETADAQLADHGNHLAKLRQQKQGLMHDLLTGQVQLRVEQPDSNSPPN